MEKISRYNNSIKELIEYHINLSLFQHRKKERKIYLSQQISVSRTREGEVAQFRNPIITSKPLPI